MKIKLLAKIYVVSTIAFLSLWIAGLALTGCKSTPQQAAFQTAGITDVAVTSAIQAYDIAAKDGKTTIEENQKVAAAFAKYKQAMAVALDAGAVYAASSATNQSASSAVLQQATLNATASLSDVLNLVSAFAPTNK